MTPDVLLIAPADLLPALTTACASLGTVQAFADTDALAALDTAFQQLPREVVLERGFAESGRGRAFLRRLADDTFARECLIRIVDSLPVAPLGTAVSNAAVLDPAALTREDAPGAGAPAPAEFIVDAAAPEAEVVAPRATPRLGVAPGTTVAVDGTDVTLVDLSPDGMQIVGTLPLKPNQAVRVTLPDDAQGVRVRGRVAWAAMELVGAGGPRYRAGFAFVDADRAALEPVVTRLTSAVLSA